MPRTYPPRRTLTCVRLAPAGLDAIDALALRRGLTKSNGEPNRSEMIRRLLAEAMALPHNQLREGTHHARREHQ